MTKLKIKESLLPKFSLNRPVTVMMILLAVLVVGIIGYYRVKMDLFPTGLSFPFINVYVPYSDANPKEIEEQIVRPLESELKTVKNLKKLYSYSGSSGCSFDMQFAQGTNVDLAYTQVAERIERARPLLPEDQEHIYIYRHRDNDEPIIYMGISYDKSIRDPYWVTEQFIKHPIEGIKGVANVEIWGIKEKYIQIIIDTDKVQTYRVNLPQLMGKLMQDNFAMSNGYVYMGRKKYMLRTKSRFHTLEDIQNIEIGNGVRLKHIAEVIYDFDEEQRYIMRVDGKIAAGVGVFKESGANTVEVCRKIEEKLKEQLNGQKDLTGVDYFIFWNQGKEINDSIGNVKTTMMWGGFFAFFVLLVFLRKVRITLMLTLAIPLSLLISVLCIYTLGWTLNAFTMMGMMISIGLVVDNSIVITENIYRLNGLGHEKRQASILGASEVGLAIVLATLTTIVVFLPMMIMTGNSIISFYLTRIGVPVIFAITGSLFIALLLIPLASLKTIPSKVEILHATHGRITQWYQTAMVKILKHRFDSMLIIILLIASMVIPQKLMKRSDSAEGGPRDAKVICNFPSYYNIEKSDQITNYIANKILEKKEEYHISHISTRTRTFWGMIEIYLEPDQDTQWYQVIYRKIANTFGFSNYKRLTREELTNDIKENLPVIPDVKLRTTWRQESDSGQEEALTYVLNGYDIGVLDNLAKELEKQIRLVDGVLSVETDTETGNDEIHIRVNRDRAFKVGTSPNYVSQLVRFSLGKRKISNYHSPEKEIGIFVKTKPDQRESVLQLKNTFITTDSGAETNLDALAGLTYHKSVGRIRRENGKAALQMKIFFADEDTKVMTQRIEQIFKSFKLPTGYSYQQGGKARQLFDQDQDTGKALIFSMVLVFIIMGILFESFILPISVIVAIPAAFVGSFWLMYLTNTTFEIMAGIGLVVLVGVVVNNAIVLIDLINQYRKGGMQREQAILVAGMHRFRPILMTALTTIFGLLPMAIGNTGLLGIPYAPMGVTLIGGLISSTFLTLFAVPVFYTYFDDLRHFFPKMLRRIF
jgi:hydrophobic/amphiphilic exporter-1 (mainly G- bacteria), HAE1 family